MADAAPDHLLDALLDSWDWNNAILVNLLRLVPDAGMDIRPMADSPSVAQLFTHIHYCRLVVVQEDAPEVARPVPEVEWRSESDRERLAAMLHESADAVRDAVRGRLAAGRPMDLHYDNPILMMQHLIWHEGYHHGQIKLALKLAGQTVRDDDAGLVTWDLWMDKDTWRSPRA